MQILSRCAARLSRWCHVPLLLLLLAPAAWAQDAAGGVVAQPHPWQIGLQSGYSPVMRDMIWLNDWIVTPIIVFIVLLVAGLGGFALWRFNHKRHPVPSRITHNAPLEIAWTVIPALILVGMAIPSFRLVFFENKTDHPYMTLDVTGHQWYWEYKYPGQGNLDFISNIIPQNQLKPGQLRLLSVNHPLVLPVGENIRVLQTSGDVIHSFFVPSLGMQRYAIPGQTIETWVKIDQPGTFYGECNQICGLNHHEMPIEVQAVPVKQFLAWAKLAEQQQAENGTIPPVSAVMYAAAGKAAAGKLAELTDRPGGSLQAAPGKGD
ncbi:MAG: cytochrome c oxidase subunit II [Acetobacteraceae bacterium]